MFRKTGQDGITVRGTVGQYTVCTGKDRAFLLSCRIAPNAVHPLVQQIQRIPIRLLRRKKQSDRADRPCALRYRIPVGLPAE